MIEGSGLHSAHIPLGFPPCCPKSETEGFGLLHADQLHQLLATIIIRSEVGISQELIGLSLYLIHTYIDADFANANVSFGPMSETDKLPTITRFLFEP